MPPTPPPPLLPSTRALCRQEPYAVASEELTLPGVLGRLAIAGLILVGTTLVLPLLPSRHKSSPEAEWFASAAIGLLLAGSYLYTYVWRPLFGREPGYRLVGEFVVREKYSVLGTKLLRIRAADEQHLRINDELYNLLRDGDRVRVVYSAGGELIRVTKLAGAPPD